MTKKALIFDPYFDTLGGGEYYTIAVMEYLLKRGFRIELAWFEEDIINKIKKRFNVDFKNKIIINKKIYQLITVPHKIWEKYWQECRYELIFFVSDGSIPFLFGKQNWLHFQIPFTQVRGHSLFNKIKLKNIFSIICNSNFVKKYIDKEFNLNSLVIYPPINNLFFEQQARKKENLILSVGRFDQILNAKRQDILVKAFQKMVNRGLKGWQLVLAGGLMKRNYHFNNLEDIVKGYPIKILTNIDFNDLIKYYQKAKIYWHAAGYGAKINQFPQRAEHFGISVVEAMASQAVPLVYNAGGLPEIVQDEKLRWNSIEELINKTAKLIKEEQFKNMMIRKIQLQAKKFQKKYFDQQFSLLLK